MTSTMTKFQNDPSPQHPGSDTDRGWKNYEPAPVRRPGQGSPRNGR